MSIDHHSKCALFIRRQLFERTIMSVRCSHAWRYKFLDVLDALQGRFESQQMMFLWFDLFSNNQHGLNEPPPFSWWCETFMGAIRSMNRVVMVMEPWDNPVPLTRAWCLWELYCTSAVNAAFEVTMSANESRRFQDMISVDSRAFYDMLGNVDVRNSSAWNPLDKEQIFAVVSQNVGFVALNNLVNERLREWVLEEVLAMDAAVSARLVRSAGESGDDGDGDVDCTSSINAAVDVGIKVSARLNKHALYLQSIRTRLTVADVQSRQGLFKESIRLLCELHKQTGQQQPESAAEPKPSLGPNSFLHAKVAVKLADVVRLSCENKVLVPQTYSSITRAVDYERSRFESGTIADWLNRYISKANYNTMLLLFDSAIEKANAAINCTNSGTGNGSDDAERAELASLLRSAMLGKARIMNLDFDRADASLVFARETYNHHVSTLATPNSNASAGSRSGLGVVGREESSCDIESGGVHASDNSEHVALASSVPDQIAVLEAMNVYANALAINGDFAEALSFYHDCMERLQTLLPKNHPTVLDYGTTLGDVYNYLDMFAEASEHYTRCMLASEEKFGPKSVQFISLRKKLRDMRARHGNLVLLVYDHYLYGMIMVFRKQYGQFWYYRWKPSDDSTFVGEFDYVPNKWPHTSVGKFIYFGFHFTLTWAVVAVIFIPLTLFLCLRFQMPTLARLTMFSCVSKDVRLKLYGQLGICKRNESKYGNRYQLFVLLLQLLSCGALILCMWFFKPEFVKWAIILVVVSCILPFANLYVRAHRRNFEKEIPDLEIDI